MPGESPIPSGPRGRLNVLANVIRKDLEQIFCQAGGGGRGGCQVWAPEPLESWVFGRWAAMQKSGRRAGGSV